MESIVNVLGSKFAGALIEDPVLEPYFITSETGSYTVSKKRIDGDGNLRYSDLYYLSTFESCLLKIAKEKISENKAYESIQRYIDEWKKVTSEIFEACKKSGINKL